uniref:Galactose-3-O-sulfotransferase 1 n=1 Tax=Ciona savignyi TaxID=51511 RepID=H2YT13_CIOSA
MKTHKTAGTTVQNVLLRYANTHELVVGLPATADPRFNYPSGEFFNRTFVRKSEKPINMLCHHMRFHAKEVKAILPDDTFYVTIIREAGSLFESMFDYFHYNCKAFARTPLKSWAIDEFLSQPNRFFKGSRDGTFWWFAKNAMFYDLGYDNLNTSDGYINTSITNMDQTFDFVMLAEYFDISMVLLMDLLCWDIQDVVFLINNARSTPRDAILEERRKKIENWNRSDALMYHYFNASFWKRVENYGFKKMNENVAKLREANRRVEDQCIDGSAVGNSLIRDPANKIYNPRGVKMKGYNLKPESEDLKICQDITRSEIKWFHYLLRKQYLT